MLENDTKKKLYKQKWRDIVDPDKNRNPSETVKRLKKHCKNAIIALKLLARRIPNDLQQEALPYEDIKALVGIILSGSIEGLNSYNTTTKESLYRGQNEDCDEVVDRRTLKIAACMVEEGIKVCSRAYWKIQQDPRLNKLATDKLDEAVMLCNAIAHPRVGKRLTIKYDTKKGNRIEDI